MQHPAPVSGHEPTVGSALEHLVGATQGVIRDQLELARLEAREAAKASLKGVAALLVGGVFLLVGWVALSLAAYALLVSRFAPWTSFGIVAAINVVIGAAVAAYGASCLRDLRGS